MKIILTGSIEEEEYENSLPQWKAQKEVHHPIIIQMQWKI